MAAKFLSAAEAASLRQSFSAWLLVEPYLSNLRIGNRSPQTIAEYRKTLHVFCLEVSCSLHVTLPELRAWIASMHERGLKASTISARMTTMRSFFNFAVAEGLLPANPILRLPKVKVGRRLPKALSPEEIRAFFAAVAAGLTGVHPHRLRHSCATHYLTGGAPLSSLSRRPHFFCTRHRSKCMLAAG